MDEPKTPPTHLGSCRYVDLCRGALDLSIIQGPFPVAPCQTLISRFATFPIAVGGSHRTPVAHSILGQLGGLRLIRALLSAPLLVWQRCGAVLLGYCYGADTQAHSDALIWTTFCSRTDSLGLGFGAQG